MAKKGSKKAKAAVLLEDVPGRQDTFETAKGLAPETGETTTVRWTGDLFVCPSCVPSVKIPRGDNEKCPRCGRRMNVQVGQ